MQNLVNHVLTFEGSRQDVDDVLHAIRWESGGEVIDIARIIPVTDGGKRCGAWGPDPDGGEDFVLLFQTIGTAPQPFLMGLGEICQWHHVDVAGAYADESQGGRLGRIDMNGAWDVAGDSPEAGRIREEVGRFWNFAPDEF